jgi:hypothetical protein
VQRSLAEQRLVHRHRRRLRIVLRAGPSSEHDLGAAPLRADAQHRTTAGTPTRSTSHTPSLQPGPARYERQNPQSALRCRKAKMAPWAVEGQEATDSQGRSPAAESSTNGSHVRNAKAAGPAGTRTSQGREVRGRDRRTCHGHCWQAGPQSPWLSPYLGGQPAVRVYSWDPRGGQATASPMCSTPL